MQKGVEILRKATQIFGVLIWMSDSGAEIFRCTFFCFLTYQAWATADPEDIWNGFKPVCWIRHLACSEK